MRAELVARGIPDDKIWVESVSPDTHEQAIRLSDLLRGQGIDSFVLVTSPSHMRRALGAFAAMGMHPIPSAAVAARRARGLEPSIFLPSADGLDSSQAAAREVLALIYYSLRGWLG
jgi:uncharacterized SAM-binding protein YcdF (DUF218 family)